MKLQRLIIAFVIVIALLALAVAPALGAGAPPGLHKAPAAIKVVHGPAGGVVCVKCHPAPCAACHP
jgi:hypothetical protein